MWCKRDHILRLSWAILFLESFHSKWHKLWNFKWGVGFLCGDFFIPSGYYPLEYPMCILSHDASCLLGHCMPSRLRLSQDYHMNPSWTSSEEPSMNSCWRDSSNLTCHIHTIMEYNMSAKEQVLQRAKMWTSYCSTATKVCRGWGEHKEAHESSLIISY